MKTFGMVVENAILLKNLIFESNECLLIVHSFETVCERLERLEAVYESFGDRVVSTERRTVPIDGRCH